VSTVLSVVKKKAPEKGAADGGVRGNEVTGVFG
jgi:hypothetical protein